MGIKLSCLLVILMLLTTRCSKDEDRLVLFTRLSSDETNITFVNENIENEKYNVFTYEYFYNGGGVAIGDINNDGLPDIYFSSNQDENKLYLNKGNLEFEDITRKSKTEADKGWKTGVSMVDINADGYLDIYVCKSFEENPFWRENLLFINNRDLTFTEQGKEYGLNDNSYSTHAAFFDYDRDGDLDAFMLNHSVPKIAGNFDIRTASITSRAQFAGNRLLENRNGRFFDVSDSVGIFGPPHNYGLGICPSDVNNDGWMDLYTSNDYYGKDNLLLNENGHFRNSTDSLLTHISRFSMGTDIADINNDGLTDIMSLDMLPDNNKRQKELLWAEGYDIYIEMCRAGLHHQFMRNMLHLNNGNGKFSEIGQLAGVSNTDWSWAALFADFDNDGLQDLFVSNGYKRDYTNNDFAKYRANQMLAKEQGKKTDNYAKMLEKMPSNKVHNYLFKNLNGLQFEEASEKSGLGEGVLSHGAAYTDLDNDGDLDLVVNNMDEEAAIYRNNSNKLSSNSFLKVKLKGNNKNLNGIGARVTVYVNGQTFLRELCPARGFQSSVEPVLNFGLGHANIADSLTVQWPTGEYQVMKNVAVNKEIVLYQKDAVPFDAHGRTKPDQLFLETENVLNFHHKENEFIDFKTQPLLYRMYSSMGPALAKGDVNGDGLIDFYLGGAKDQSGSLFIQNKNGSFDERLQRDFLSDAAQEDVDAIFVDVDGDDDLDLYVVSGGYEFPENDPLLQDRLYKNDGTGRFKKSPLPKFLSNGSCVRPNDIDGDGDVDLFVGGRIINSRYPYTPESNILLNDGRGVFTISTGSVSAGLRNIGMVTDARWIDLNKDNVNDLIVVGEWMPIMVFINEGGKLVDRSSNYIPEKTNGFWNCLLVHDFDNDGDSDFIAGNYGLNNQIKASLERPADLYYYDFDQNRSVDPLLCYYVKDKSYPFATRDELTEQLPAFKKKFPNYSSYSDATVNSILSDEALRTVPKMVTYMLETTYFENRNGSFSIKKLPIELQFAPVFTVALMDVNGDGFDDLITGGNLERTRARTGLLKGNNGYVFLGDNKGNFRFVKPTITGVSLTDDVRKIIVDADRVFFGINNGKVKSFKLTRKHFAK